MEVQRSGAIVNITSSASYRPGAPGLVHHVAGKHALWSLTESAAIELGPYGIRSNSVAPGSSLTEGLRAYIQEGASDGLEGHEIDTQFREVRNRTPFQRMCDPDDVARAVLFLASDLSAFLNGIQVPVDGGLILLA